ncbi:hypothetical protein BH23VER1_BH23VER1_03870 [soil metagenome]
MAAQSPLEGGAGDGGGDRRDYRRSWAVTTRLMAEGKSFSGRERNTVFLNTRGADGGFADVSGVSGFDYLDDARAIALVDWDFDGDLDFWVANRSGPRLRLMRNDFPSAGNWVAFRLEGSVGNRDAIGARVTVKTADGPPLIRTLRAGEGFLSQSTKWLHFGLGDAAEITGVTVRWPGGAKEEFAGAGRPAAFYLLREGEGAADQWHPPTGGPVTLADGQQEEPESSGQARIVASARLPMPPFELDSVDEPGSQITSSGVLGQGGPVLINLWATWCVPCLAELAEFHKRADALAAAGLEILLVNVDDPTAADVDTRRQGAKRVLDGFDSRLPSALADAAFLDTIDLFQRTHTQRQLAMPVPTSFLIDGRGHLAAIYKGVASVDQILADVDGLVAARPEALRDLAVAAPGRWFTNPQSANPLRFAMKLFDAQQPAAAEAYLRTYLETWELAAAPSARRPQLGDVHFAIGRFAVAQGAPGRAIEAYRQAVAADPESRSAHLALGKLLVDSKEYVAADAHLGAALQLDRSDSDALTLQAMARIAQGKFRDAEILCQDALDLAPENVGARYNLAFALQQQGRWREAASAYHEVLKRKSDWAMAANNLAWILAAAPDDSLRDGGTALRISASLASSDAGGSQPIFWMTYGAALAETGDFPSAAAAAERAISLLGESGTRSALMGELVLQRARYRSGTPWRIGSAR